MNHLIVYAHPNPASLSHALLETLQAAYEAQGHTVRVRDLYALGFDPVLKGRDFEAMQAGAPLADVATEQGHITWADAVTVIYPVWWTGLPAILKGWVDRVLTHGYAFRYDAQGVQGLLKGKKAFLVSCHGTPAEYYAEMQAAMKQTSDTGIFAFCGFEVTEHLFFGAVPMVDDATRKGYLAQAREAAARHFAPASV